jgi:hypothetical protein
MKPTPNPKKATAKPGKQPEPVMDKTSGGWFFFLFKPYNLLFAFVAILTLTALNKNVPSYNWVYNGLLKDGYKYCGMVQQEIEKRCSGVQDPAVRRQIAYDTKYEAKIGTEFLVLKQIRDNTPPNAVILFPPPLVLTQKTSYLSLRYEIGMKPWAAHFLYPRTIVYEQEKGKNPFYDKAQYIFILHGWGFDHLDYEPRQRNLVDILPLHKSPNQ